MAKCPRTAVYSCGNGERLYFCADHMAQLRAVFDEHGVDLKIKEYTGKRKCVSLKGADDAGT